MLIRPFVNFRVISHLVLIDLCSPSKSPAAGWTCYVWCADSANLGREALLLCHAMLQQSMPRILLVVFRVGTLFASFFCLLSLTVHSFQNVLAVFPNGNVLGSPISEVL